MQKILTRQCSGSKIVYNKNGLTKTKLGMNNQHGRLIRASKLVNFQYKGVQQDINKWICTVMQYYQKFKLLLILIF